MSVSSFLGDTARPLAIIFTSFGASIASVIVALKVRDGNDGAIFMAAVFAGVGAIYIGKAVEAFKNRRADAEVEIAKVNAGVQS